VARGGEDEGLEGLSRRGGLVGYKGVAGVSSSGPDGECKKCPRNLFLYRKMRKKFPIYGERLLLSKHFNERKEHS